MEKRTSRLSKINIKPEISITKIKAKIVDHGQKALMVAVTTQYLANLNVTTESYIVAIQHIVKQKQMFQNILYVFGRRNSIALKSLKATTIQSSKATKTSKISLV